MTMMESEYFDTRTELDACYPRPDVNNLCKMLFDAMSILGFWNDDGQIADMRARKMRGQDTGLAACISEIGAGE